MFRRILSFIVVLIGCLWGANALAARPTDPRAAATLAEKAERALQRKDYASAAENYEKAESFAHSPTHLVGLGHALVGLGEPARAYENFDRVVREGVPANSPRTWHRALTEAKSELIRLKPELAWLTVTVTGPVEPSVQIDTQRFDSKKLGERWPIVPGKHVITVSAPGFVSERRSVALDAGSSESFDFILQSVGANRSETASKEPDEGAMKPAALYDEPVKDVDEDALRTRKTLMYVALGVGGAGLVTGGIFGALALSKQDDLEDGCGSDRACPGALESTLDDYHTFGTISGVGFAFALAGAGTGIALLITEPEAKVKPQTATKIKPYVGFGTVGAMGEF